ncbi:hypothetical protein PHISCL_03609 [Aspergillus sclerotialis]|uniref:Uncharacterized protein n=1 Tax=Aspergillus sclerotialis TaxID=2070753 RepID=A0A3A2ZP95_9EURO|nr:hypothetical protein PHISCL_03609 [Aspergillus sclerotialis]
MDNFVHSPSRMDIHSTHTRQRRCFTHHDQNPKILKGSDMVLYPVFKSLGVAVDVRPTLEYDGHYHTTNKHLNLKYTVGGKHTFFYDTGFSRKTSSVVRVGKAFHPYTTSEDGGYELDDIEKIAEEEFPLTKRKASLGLRSPSMRKWLLVTSLMGKRLGSEPGTRVLLFWLLFLDDVSVVSVDDM